MQGEVIASSSHYFQAGCRGSLSQVEPVLAAGTRADKGGELGVRPKPCCADKCGLGRSRCGPPASGGALPGLRGAAAAPGSAG